MSYDFMMFRVTGNVRTPDDLAEETTKLHAPGSELQVQLSRLYPTIEWHRSEPQRVMFGNLDGVDGWYEFMLYEDPNKTFSIKTSDGADTRWLIPEICEALGVVAFDGQAYALIGV